MINNPETLESTVTVRTEPRVETVARVVLATELETKPSFDMCENTGMCCEDCPDVNDTPPEMSECPYFEYEKGRWPVCTRDGNSDQYLNQIFFNT